MIILRKIVNEIERLAKEYPVVTLLGPRQAGKTTLVKSCFPNKQYVNLEHPQIRLLAQEDPVYFISQYSEGAIFDEVQRVPELLSYIQVLVDEQQINGQFILTGSHQLALHEAVSQSLAGRTGILSLYPFSINELKGHYQTDRVDELLLKGFYPRIYDQDQRPDRAYANYIQTYLERDLREMIHIKDLMNFQKFLKLCAGRVGQLLNMHSLGNELGISSHTVKHWISCLQASYLVVLLPPYFENVGKRLIKAPKLYFTDVGLVAHLLGISTSEQMSRDPLRGQLFENMVVMDVYKHYTNQGKVPDLYFYRDSSGQEIDLICKEGNITHTVEIKSSLTYHPSMGVTLRKMDEILGRDCMKSIIYPGENRSVTRDFRLVNYQDVDQIF